MPNPTIVQYYSSSANAIAVVTEPGSDYSFQIPNPVLKGNAVVFIISWTAVAGVGAPSLVDDGGNDWSKTGQPICVGSTNTTATFVLLNAKAFQAFLGVHFSKPVILGNVDVIEINDVGFVSGFTQNPGLVAAAPNLNTGPLLPTNNDGNGGNFLIDYFIVDNGAGANPTGWTKDSGATLLNADTSWTNNQGVPHAVQYRTQSSQASITPAITCVGSTDSYNCITISLGLASAGQPVPSGIRVGRIIGQFGGTLTGATVLKLPSVGNLRVLMSDLPTANYNATGITDSDGKTWANVGSVGATQIWYAKGCVPNSNLSVTVTASGTPSNDPIWYFYDIVGADANPLGTVVEDPSQDVSNNPSVDNLPTIAVPANCVVLACMGLGIGPALGFHAGAPAGAIYDNINYSGKTDSNTLDHGSGRAHIYVKDAATQNWNWLITRIASNGGWGTAVVFKCAFGSGVSRKTVSPVGARKGARQAMAA